MTMVETIKIQFILFNLSKKTKTDDRRRVNFYLVKNTINLLVTLMTIACPGRFVVGYGRGEERRERHHRPVTGSIPQCLRAQEFNKRIKIGIK